MLILLFILIGCHNPHVTVDKTGTYRLLRAESKDASGIIDIELWSKDGVSTNKYVYMKRTLYGGDIVFVRIEP
jgi:hypothetical protein